MIEVLLAGRMQMASGPFGARLLRKAFSMLIVGPVAPLLLAVLPFFWKRLATSS